MAIELFTNMFLILFLCPVLLVAGVQTLTIDTQLGTSVEDCFERISIGEHLPRDAIYRNVSELTTRECEQICKQDKQCQSYDYGVGAKGNATCNLSNLDEKEIKEKGLLKRDSDYDVYIRRINCEQSPPTPIQGQFNDPEEGPAHRPIFRPEIDEKRPLTNDFHDQRPFETVRPDFIKPIPPYRPNRPTDPYRPDDNSYQKPNYNSPPVYGDHKPVEIPLKPTRPSYKPDPYDTLYFRPIEDKPYRPQDPGLYRPDPLYPPQYIDDIQDIYSPKPKPRPPLAPYIPDEKPLYHYIIRPNRKPQTQIPRPGHYGYGNHPQPDDFRPDPYGPIGPPSYNRPNNPINPYRPDDYSYQKPNYNKPPVYGDHKPVEIPYRPIKPYEKPVYHYNSQYASNYGQNNDNSIHVEIVDPPRPYKPYKPSRPSYTSQNYFGFDNDDNNGYGIPHHGTHHEYSQGGYGHNQNSYGSGSHNQNSSYGQKPHNTYIEDKPQSSYGNQRPENLDTSYEGQKPSYNEPAAPSYSNNYGSNSHYYGHHKPQDISNSYDIHNKPSYNDAYPSHGVSQKPAHHEHFGSYGQTSQQGYDSYYNNRPSYGNFEENYNHRPSHNRPSYGQDTNQLGGYNNHDKYDTHKPSYGQEEVNKYPSTSNYDPPNQNGYGYEYNEIPGYQSHKKPNRVPSYGPSTSNYNNQSTYGDKPTQKPYRPQATNGYGNQEEDSGYKPANTSGYNHHALKPVYEYELDKPHNVPSYIYGPNGDIVTSRPVSIGDYGGNFGRDPGYSVSYKACFRRVLAGHRALRSFVRRAVPCETLEDCRRECAEERRFHCESFNYRLDPSFRSKGLCELMTRPIESFDVPRDFVEDKNYDFYEVDRNSLEPSCAETLGGPGLLHSGFLSSKPSRPGGWRDRNWSGYDGSGREDRYNQRRHHERYIPYQIGMPSLSRTLDPDTFGQYGGEYGGTNNYYKDRNDYHKSINYWQLSHGVDLQKYFGVKPLVKTVYDEEHYSAKPVEKPFDVTNHLYEFNEGFGSWKRGHWNASGSWQGMEYGESNYYKPLKADGFHGAIDRQDGGEKDCSSRRRPGMSLGSGAIRRSLLVKTVLHCEEACFEETEFKCVSYSFRYSSSANDNCFLSERPYRVLELSADTGSDVYAMMDRDCTSVAKKAWVESECFWHVRSGYAVDSSTSRAELTTSGLGACEAECIRAVHFYCRGFSFRFDAPSHGDELPNCILTSSPPTSLDAGHGLRSNSGHELYARGNYGRGCEPAVYDDVQHPETECYLQYDKSARLVPTSIKGRAKVTDPKECGHACSEAPFECLTYSFETKSSSSENCFLSEVRLFDLRASVDYEHAPDHLLFSFDLFNGQCWKKLKEKHDESSELPHPISRPHPSVDKHDSGPDYLPSGPPDTYPSGPITGTGYKPTYPSAPDSKPGYLPEITGPSYPGGFKPGYPPADRPGYLPELPIGPSGSPSRPGYQPSGPHHFGYLPSGPPPDHRPGYDRPDPGYIPGYRPPPPEVPTGYPDREVETPGAVSWRHYTVSGFPCRRGSSCAKNHITGYWACEPEGGEIGSWDYCCAPTHRCGYSEGFNKPWCYVGPTDDQWRPCSEKYYPYHQHNIPHPSQGHKDPNRPPRPWAQNRPTNIRERPTGPYLSDADRKYWDDLFKDGPKSYYDKHGNPLPGYARVPTVTRPNIRYRHNYNNQGDGHWLPLTGHEYDPPMRGELGVPRYWPVAYLHKEPPPNMTYFGYNETYTTTTERYVPRSDNIPSRDNPIHDFKRIDLTKSNDSVTENSHRDVKNRNISAINVNQFNTNVEDLKILTTTTSKSETKVETITEASKEKDLKPNLTDVETIKPVVVKSEIMQDLKGIDDKIDDFSKSIEVLDIEDAQKGDKASEIKTLEAEERQIEAIGRLLANRRGNKLVLEKRSQKDLENSGISLDDDMLEFNFGNKFKPPERRGIIQKVTKEEIEMDRQQDKSLEVSETTFVRPPRVLSTTENVRKTIINGKVFYDASIKDREQRDLVSSSTRRPKSLRFEDPRIPTTTPNSFGKRRIRARSSNPIRRTRRVYKKRYNPEEVRRRLLEREKSNKQEVSEKTQ